MDAYNETVAVGRIIEGTGEEIAAFARQHPAARFKLVVVEASGSGGAPTAGSWDRFMKHAESLRERLPILPADAVTTDSLYD